MEYNVRIKPKKVSKRKQIENLIEAVKEQADTIDKLKEEVQALRFLSVHPSGWRVSKTSGLFNCGLRIYSVNEDKSAVCTYQLLLSDPNTCYWVENGKYLEIWDKTHDRLEKVFTVKGDDIIEADLELYSCYVTRKAAA